MRFKFLLEKISIGQLGEENPPDIDHSLDSINSN